MNAFATIADLAAVPAPTCRLIARRTGPADLYATSVPAKRVVAARLFWLGGPLAETVTSAGVHALTMQALIRTSAPRQALAERLEAAGVTVTAGVTPTCCYLDLRGPREQLHEALRHAARTVAAAQVDASAFAAACSATAHQLEQRRREAKLLAGDHFRAARTGLASPPEGTPESLAALRRDDVEAAAVAITRQRFGLVIAGDPDVDAYVDAVAALAAVCAGHPPPEAAPLVLTAPERIQIDTGTGRRAQGYLLWGTVTPIDGVADHVTAEAAAHVLGGWSGSRWQSLFREELGYTYGTSASTTSMRIGGRDYCMVQIGMSVSAAALPKAREMLASQAAQFVERGPDPGELAAAAARLLRTEAHFHDSTRNLMARTASYPQAGLDADFAQRRIAALREPDADRRVPRLRQLLGQTTLLTLAAGPDAP